MYAAIGSLKGNTEVNSDEEEEEQKEQSQSSRRTYMHKDENAPVALNR